MRKRDAARCYFFSCVVYIHTYIVAFFRYNKSLAPVRARRYSHQNVFYSVFYVCVFIIIIIYMFVLSLSLSKTSLAFIHHRLYQRMHLRHVYYRPHHPHAHHRRNAQQMLQMVRAPYPRRVDVRRARAFQHAKRKRRSPKSHSFLFFSSSSSLSFVFVYSLSSKIFYYTFSLSLSL